MPRLWLRYATRSFDGDDDRGGGLRFGGGSLRTASQTAEQIDLPAGADINIAQCLIACVAGERARYRTERTRKGLVLRLDRAFKVSLG